MTPPRQGTTRRPTAKGGTARIRPPARAHDGPPAPAPSGALDAESLHLIDAYWRASNYLAAAQIYLLANPLLLEPLQPEHIKPRLLGHWGSAPGLNLVYVHMNRAIRARDLDAIFVTGPGHGAPAVVAQTYLEGHLQQRGLRQRRAATSRASRRLVRQFSFPGGIPSHARPGDAGIDQRGRRARLLAPPTPPWRPRSTTPTWWSAASSRRRRGRDGTLAAAGRSNKFLDPVSPTAPSLPVPAPERLQDRGAHGLSRPDTLATSSDAFFTGCGYRPLHVAGDEPAAVHEELAAALDDALDDIARIQEHARSADDHGRPRWPMIVLETPKGWTGPEEVDGVRVEGTFHSHQVPLAQVRTNPEHLAQLEAWLRSYHPDELFDDGGALVPEVAALVPAGRSPDGLQPARQRRRPAARPRPPRPARVRRPRRRPRCAVRGGHPDAGRLPARRVGPQRDGTQLQDLRTRRDPVEPPRPGLRRDRPHVDGHDHRRRRAPGTAGPGDGGPQRAPVRGLAGGVPPHRPPRLFNSYEAFIHIVDSMFNQHAKWLKVSRTLPWRRPIASLNYLLTSHVWRQDHNGFSHRTPVHRPVVNKKAEIVRVYLHPTPTPPVHRRPVPAQPRPGERGGGPQAPSPSGSTWTPRCSTYPAA